MFPPTAQLKCYQSQKSVFFKLFFWITTIKKNVAEGSSFSLIFKQNYTLTEISKRINGGFVFQRGITPLLTPPLTPQNQVRDYKQKAAQSHPGSYQINTTNRVTKFIPATRRKSAACMSLGLTALASRLAFCLVGKFRKITLSISLSMLLWPGQAAHTELLWGT